MREIANEIGAGVIGLGYAPTWRLSDVPMMAFGFQPFDDEGNGDETAMLFQFSPYVGLFSGMEPW